MMSKRSLLLASTAVGFMLTSPVLAAPAPSGDALKSLQKEVAALQKQIDALEVQQKAAPAAEKATATEAKSEILPGVKVTLGGFFETDGIFRSKNETTDLISNFNAGIPFENSANAHQGEFRGTARATRLQMLAEGSPDNDTKLTAFLSGDFLGAAPTANSIETSSWNPRLREAYVTVDRSDWGLHTLVGQSWSLVTMYKDGLTPRKENLPLTIEGAYVPGFNYDRTTQVRVVKDLDDKKVNVGLSLESPQVSFGGITQPSGVIAYNAGVSPLSTANYSTDFAPDVVGKVAFDPGWGHFEAFGVARFFHDMVGTTNKSAMGGGGGVGMILPVIAKKLDVQANIMAGQGVGRYGPVLLPDFAFSPTGAIIPLTEYTALIGVVGHPDPTWDIYTYAGGERVNRQNEAGYTLASGIGYGNFALNNSGCDSKTGATCQAQTQDVWQVTGGFWKQIYNGSYGTMKVGLQDSLTRRDAFTDSNGNGPHSWENMVFTSFRYSPF